MGILTDFSPGDHRGVCVGGRALRACDAYHLTCQSIVQQPRACGEMKLGGGCQARWRAPRRVPRFSQSQGGPPREPLTHCRQGKPMVAWRVSKSSILYPYVCGQQKREGSRNAGILARPCPDRLGWEG